MDYKYYPYKGEYTLSTKSSSGTLLLLCKYVLSYLHMWFLMLTMILTGKF